MIAQPVARILICIPRRPARPGHQPTFAPTLASPGATAHAEGRGLAAFPKAPRTRASCLRGKPRETAEKGDVAWVSSLADQLQRRKFPPPPGPRPPLTLAEVGLSAGPVPSTQETNLSSAPCVLGIPSPSLPSFSIPSLSPGIPQSRSQSQKAPAPHPSTAAAPLSSLDRHVGSPGEFPFPPPPS